MKGCFAVLLDGHALPSWREVICVALCLCVNSSGISVCMFELLVIVVLSHDSIISIPVIAVSLFFASCPLSVVRCSCLEIHTVPMYVGIWSRMPFSGCFSHLISFPFG